MPEAKKKDLVLKELQRKANDEIMVHNFKEESYFVKWGGNYFEVPGRDKDMGYGKGNMVLVRYLAMKYCREMTDKLILEESAKIVAKAKEKYTGNFFPAEEERIALRTDNKDLRKRYLKVLWLGLHRKFGLDELPEQVVGLEPKRKDTRSLDEQLIEEMQTEAEKAKEAKKTPKEELVEEIAEKKK